MRPASQEIGRTIGFTLTAAGTPADAILAVTLPLLITSTVAGNPEGKYAIFVNTYNWAARPGGAPMQIYLLQQ